jgi:hypothetical protein
MKKVFGLRPQDVLVLLKMIELNGTTWRTVDIAAQLFMSQSEISEALYRAWYAGLVDDSKRIAHRESVLEFLLHGVKYAFPQRPGAIVRGMPTAHSAPPLSGLLSSSTTVYVWPDTEGIARGETIEPLYPSVPKAAKQDQQFYELVSLVDALRVGKSRERTLAATEIEKRVRQR